MSHEKLKRRLVGPASAIITPLKKDRTLDKAGMRQNIRFMLDHGFRDRRGWILGPTPGGESPFMSMRARKEAMAVIADEAGGALPIQAGVHDNSFEAVVDLMRHAKDVGFDLVQLQPPWYHHTGAEEAYRYYQEVTEKVDIPVIIINNYWQRLLDGAGMNEPVFERLSGIENLVGVAWGSPNWYTYVNVIRQFKDRFVFIDNNWLGLGLFWGCTSFVEVLGQVFPEYTLGLYDVLKKGDYNKATQYLWKLTLPYYLWLGKVQGQGVHGEGPLIKATMWLAGRPAGPALPPYDGGLTQEQLEGLREVLLNGGVPGVKTAGAALRAQKGS